MGTRLLAMGFEIDQIEVCQLALASSNFPLTLVLQAATERWFACLILISLPLFWRYFAFLLIHVSCPFPQLFLLLSVMFLRVGLLLFLLLVCLLRITLTHLLFVFFFLFFKVTSAGLPHCCPKLILTEWKGGTRLRWFTDRVKYRRLERT